VRSNTSCRSTDARTTFRALKVTSQVATPGAECAVYDWFAVSTVCRTTVSVLYPVRTAQLGATKLPRRVAYGGVNRALRLRTSVLITSVVFRMSIGADYCH